MKARNKKIIIAVICAGVAALPQAGDGADVLPAEGEAGGADFEGSAPEGEAGAPEGEAGAAGTDGETAPGPEGEAQ